MEKGKIKWFDTVKNYGFIEPDSGDDLFVHGSEVVGDTKLANGMRVEFDRVSGNRGDKATKVGRIKE